MAKILISLIGTGKQAKGDTKNNQYKLTDYKIEDKIYQNKSFTSNAIIEHYNIDTLFLIGTTASMWDNMAEYFGANEEYYLELLDKKENSSLNEKDLTMLEELFRKKLGDTRSKCFIIKEGENENELLNIFDKFLEILEQIKSKDEVYFDITHLFRSVSVMSFVMAELLQIDKDIKISGLFYGMFAKNGPSKIIDLKIFFELLNWAKAIEELEKFASLKRLIKLSNGKIEKNGYNILLDLDRAFSISNMTAIYKSIKKLSNHLDYLTKNDNKIIKLISPRLKNFTKELDKNTLSDFQFALAKFFADKNNYSMAYIALAEAIVSKICEKNKLDETYKEDRETAKQSLYNFGDYPYKTPQKEFNRLFFGQINRIRNNIAHQLETTKNPKDDIANFKKYLEESQKFLKEIF